VPKSRPTRPLALWGTGHHRADPQLAEHAAKLGQPARAGQLLLKRLFAIEWPEDAVPVGVEGHGTSVGRDELLGQQKVAMSILLLTEDGRQHLTGGIVYGGQQAEPGHRGSKPLMRAAVDLDQHAGLGFVLATLTVFGWSAGAGTGNSGSTQDAPQ
jgi:hypothetical protein